MQQLIALNCKILVLAVSNGTQSHPNSTKYSPDQLNILRPQESLAALNCLGVAESTEHIELNLLDGQIHLQTDQLWQSLGKLVQADDILICSYEFDGHPDHEAVGKTVQAYATAKQLLCLHVLIWAWHWAEPLDPRIDWHRAKAFSLTQEQLTKNIKQFCSLKPSLKQMKLRVMLRFSLKCD